LLNFIENKKIILVISHLIIGFLATLPFFSTIYGFSIISIPILILLYTKNKNEEAFILSSYLVGAEVFVRMTKGFVLYESGKYGVILFLLFGILIGEFKQKFSIHYISYIFLLLLGIVFTQVPEGESIRKAIAFNLSGPVLLGVCSFYFYYRTISKKQLHGALFFMLMPLISMITYLFFRTPDLKEIVFGGTANFAASGGFGPNQVATAIGLGIFIIVVFILIKKSITGFLFIDALLLIYFIYRGLLTFSRGGIFTGAITLGCFILFYSFYQRQSFALISKYLIIGGLFLVGVWLYTSNITGGMLDNRYTGKNARGVQKADISSGRVDILDRQIKSFIDNPLGIGVGNGKYKRRLSSNKVTAASHNEVGRLIEEHGVIGILLLMGIIIIPLFNFINGNNYQRAFTTAFYLFWFLTINHSAMRIAFPGFIYALSLIKIVDNEANK